MGAQLSWDKRQDNMASVEEYLREFSEDETMHVTVEKDGKIICKDYFGVTITRTNVYFNININWEDGGINFKKKKLHGYYSTTFCTMEFQGRCQKINSDEHVILISK